MSEKWFQLGSRMPRGVISDRGALPDGGAPKSNTEETLFNRGEGLSLEVALQSWKLSSFTIRQDHTDTQYSMFRNILSKARNY